MGANRMFVLPLLVVYMKKIPSSTKDVVFSATWEPTQLDENDVLIQLPMGMFPKTGECLNE